MVLSIVRLIYRRINKKLCFVSLLLALDCTTFSGKTLPKNQRLRKNIVIPRTNFIVKKKKQKKKQQQQQLNIEKKITVKPSNFILPPT